MAIIEVHVHNHIDTREIQQGLSEIRVDIKRLIAMAGMPEADRAAFLQKAMELDASTKALDATVKANPTPTPTP